MICLTEDCENEVENPDTGLCSSCGHAMRKYERQQAKQADKRQKQIQKAKEKPKKEFKPISKVSGKMATLLTQYSKKRDEWIRDKFCARCHGKAQECHHGKGKVGYADEQARMNNIPLLLDDTYWVPLCSDCHRWVTENSREAIEQGYSFVRSN